MYKYIYIYICIYIIFDASFLLRTRKRHSATLCCLCTFTVYYVLFISSMTIRPLLFGMLVLLIVNYLLVYIYWGQSSKIGKGTHFVYNTSGADEFLLFSALYKGKIHNNTQIKLQKQLAKSFQELMTDKKGLTKGNTDNKMPTKEQKQLAESFQGLMTENEWLYEGNIDNKSPRKQQQLAESFQELMTKNEWLQKGNIDKKTPRKQQKQLAESFQELMTENEWLHKGNIDKKTPRKQQKQLAKSFQELMTEDDVKILMGILERFVSAVTVANLPFFMYGGTLIGSYRHHNLVPWDDDVDLIMRSRDKSDIRKILSTLQPDFVLDDSSIRWKFYSKNSSSIPGVSWKWPFVDICFYKENSLKIWDADPGFSLKYSYDKSMVFPLRNRPFGKLRLPAPIDTKRFLTSTYDINSCKSSAYNHKVEAFMPNETQIVVPCRNLEFMYPFVHFNVTRNGTMETLRRGGEILGQWHAPSVRQN